MLSNEVFIKALVSSGRTVRSQEPGATPIEFFSIGVAPEIVQLVYLGHTHTGTCIHECMWLQPQNVLVSEENDEAIIVEADRRGR